MPDSDESVPEVDEPTVSDREEPSLVAGLLREMGYGNGAFRPRTFGK